MTTMAQDIARQIEGTACQPVVSPSTLLSLLATYQEQARLARKALACLHGGPSDKAAIAQAIMTGERIVEELGVAWGVKTA